MFVLLGVLVFVYHFGVDIYFGRLHSVLVSHDPAIKF
jgi:hypothetical protein